MSTYYETLSLHSFHKLPETESKTELRQIFNRASAPLNANLIYKRLALSKHPIVSGQVKNHMTFPFSLISYMFFFSSTSTEKMIPHLIFVRFEIRISDRSDALLLCEISPVQIPLSKHLVWELSVSEVCKRL